MQINGKPVVYMKNAAVHGGVMGMSGVVYGHPHLEDGTYAHTSGIVRRDGNEVETKNTVYILHVPA